MFIQRDFTEKRVSIILLLSVSWYYKTEVIVKILVDYLIDQIIYLSNVIWRCAICDVSLVIYKETLQKSITKCYVFAKTQVTQNV